MDGTPAIDALAEALREDGVVVDRVMGSGDAQRAHDRIAALVRDVPFPVYVALVEHPDELPTGDRSGAVDALAGLLNRRLGDGLYVLQTSDSVLREYSFGLGASPVRLSLGAGSNADALDRAMQDVGGYRVGTSDYLYPPAVVEAEAQIRAAEDLVAMAVSPSGDDDGSRYPVTLDDDDLDDLARWGVRVAATADWRPRSEPYLEVRTASRGLSALVGGLTALVVALVTGQSLRGWPRRRSPQGSRAEAPAPASPPVPTPDPEVERRRGTRLADALVRALEATDWDEVRDPDVAARALIARDVVEPLLSSADVGDLIGARIVAQAGLHDLGRGRRGGGAPWVPCFFDPRHPDGTASASWRLGDGMVDVPCCAACAVAFSEGGTPEVLRLPRGRGAVPYWERDDVWARTGFGAITDDLAGDVLAERAEER